MSTTPTHSSDPVRAIDLFGLFPPTSSQPASQPHPIIKLPKRAQRPRQVTHPPLAAYSSKPPPEVLELTDSDSADVDMDAPPPPTSGAQRPRQVTHPPLAASSSKPPPEVLELTDSDSADVDMDAPPPPPTSGFNMDAPLPPPTTSGPTIFAGARTVAPRRLMRDWKAPSLSDGWYALREDLHLDQVREDRALPTAMAESGFPQFVSTICLFIFALDFITYARLFLPTTWNLSTVTSCYAMTSKISKTTYTYSPCTATLGPLKRKRRVAVMPNS
jgi:hypothetical protein